MTDSNQRPNVSALARQHGCSRTTIRKHLASGKIQLLPATAGTSGHRGTGTGTGAAPKGKTGPQRGNNKNINSVPVPLPAPVPPPNRSIKQVALELAPPIELVRHLIILAPIAGLNIWPRVHQLLLGAADPAGWPFVGFQILTLVLLSRIPFAIERANWFVRVLLIGFGLILVATNLTFSTESIGYIRDAARDHNRGLENASDSLARQLDEARAERGALAPFIPTTADQITAAQHAVDEAITARDQECGKVGDNCRKRVAELGERQDTLSRLQFNRSIGHHATELDDKISKLTEKINAIGPKPAAQDPAAERLASITLGRMTADQIAEKLPIAWSLVAELCAFWGPWMFRRRR